MMRPELPPWLQEPALQRLFAATGAAGGEARAVGGAVRDWLMGRPVGDIDVASSLPPERSMALAQAEGWKAVPTGLAHGTVTLVLPQGEGKRVVEVTTLRRDVATDGRHAVVAYTDSFAEDAARRDFTINALSMDAQGRIDDPCGGQADMAAQHLRFIGDAMQRIEEDALRVLRYFRFLAQLGWQPHAPELEACRNAVAQGCIARLSGERIAQEMRKLLAAPAPSRILHAMAAIGLDRALTHEAWRSDVDVPDLAPQLAAYQPWVRLLALVHPARREAVAEHVRTRWRLSNKEAAGLLFLAVHAAPPTEVEVKYQLYRRQPRALVGSWMAWHGQSPELALCWDIPSFPVTAADVMALGYGAGKALGDALKAMEMRWVNSDYILTREHLLTSDEP